MRKIFTSQEREEISQSILERYPKEGAALLSKDWGISVVTVRFKARQMGVVGPRTLRRRENKVSLRMDYFDVWSISMAYDLGYIFADGSILDEEGRTPELRLRCKTKDEELILGIRSRLGSLHAITRGSTFRKGTICYYTLTAISNKEVVSSLRRHGVLPRKTYSNDPFPFVPDQFLNHFVRGYMDGDGGTWNSQDKVMCFGLVGTPLFLEQLQFKISSCVGLLKTELTSPGETTNHIKRLNWQSNYDLGKIFPWVYPQGDYPFLKRKKETFKRFMELNDRNLLAHRDNVTGYAGVSIRGEKWSAVINRGKDFFLGIFSIKEEAAHAYNVAVQILDGPRARVNAILVPILDSRKEEIQKQVAERLSRLGSRN